MSGSINPDRNRLAAEYVLGLLESEELREAERLAERDPEFQMAVLQWQSRFAEINETASPVPVPETLWHRIEADLGEQAPPRLTVDSTPVAVPSPATTVLALWHSLRFWRMAGLAGAFASLLLALGAGVLASRAAREPVLIAVLLTDESRPAAVVNAFANGRAEFIPLQGLEIPAGRALEIWAIPGANQNPISVGVIHELRSLRLNLDRLPRLRPDQVIAVSVEPPQGSPTGQPTGPVIVKGNASTAL
ncbi:anti-sigma factor [Microvirga yunnanensis]|uniref:anti-sigma factor n=1 Tax=Microvirga yunnanensis TaxID=2953740 RepID=UPI0021C9A8A4|nr:anti-sigma factor [Microvirga sp. HBU65207]